LVRNEERIERERIEREAQKEKSKAQSRADKAKAAMAKEKVKEKVKAPKAPEPGFRTTTSDASEESLSEEEIDIEAVDTEAMIREHDKFEAGRKEYMDWSNAEGTRTAEKGERKIQALFDKNKEEAEFRDGFFLGALYFHQSIPPVGETQTALAKIGLESLITPITRTPTEPKNYEVRVWEKANVKSAYKIISKRGKEIAVMVDKPFRWKDLRWIDKVVVKVTGLPFQWDKR
jgi:hypothetical protein